MIKNPAKIGSVPMHSGYFVAKRVRKPIVNPARVERARDLRGALTASESSSKLRHRPSFPKMSVSSKIKSRVV